MGRFGVGQPVRRKEDQRFITGHGRYTSDISLPDQAYAYVVRSPHANARIRGVDTAEAAAAPGVLAVLTGEDVAAGGLGGLPCLAPIKNRDGSPFAAPPHPILVRHARHVGDNVALVVAETPEQAKDAAELVMVDYEPLPAVASAAAALEPGAPQVREEAPGNLCFDWELGDKAATERAIAEAAHVVSLDFVNNRVIANSVEPRAAIGAFDEKDGRYTLYTSAQGVHGLRKQLAGAVLKMPEERLRVVIPDVGGGFGMKIFPYPEYALVLWAAKRVGRPVKWTAERGEGFTSDTHGRDHVTRTEMALDRDGRFLGLRVSTVANLGAYLSTYGPFVPTAISAIMFSGQYKIPAIHARVRGAFTNTAPVDAYRGAGRPEAAYLVERLVDVCAFDLKMDPAEIRRRNFIPPNAFPYYTTATGVTYDSGDYPAILEEALQRADRDGFPARREEARRRGKLLGLGISTYIEQCGGAPDEQAELRLDPEDRSVTLLIGNQSNGQGHETAYSQIVADALGVPFESVKVVQGDSDLITYGTGTGGSRALPVGGSATQKAAEVVIDKGKQLAADLLEAAAADIAFEDGRFTIVGTDRSVGLFEVAAAARERGQDLDGAYKFAPPEATYPNGCHVCEVEVDEATGKVDVVRYTVVDDFGRVINPLLLAGQVHGGVAQGIGQALLEEAVYDPESGQLLTGSFMDYGMPRAWDLPFLSFHTHNVLSPSNPLGVKGSGEAGAIGAPPAVINAIVNALSEFGVRHIDMPATPQKVWRAMQGAQERRAA